MNDETLWRGTFITKRIAGYECKLRISRLMQHLNFGRRDNFCTVYYISETSTCSSYRDDVIGADPSQRTEKSITVSSDSYISWMTRESCAFNVSCCNRKDILLRSFQDGYGDVESRNVEMADNRHSAGFRTLFY